MKQWKNSEFVHLHTHSEYSSFDGLATLKKLVFRAREMGFPAIALTDHGNVGGLIKLIKECNSKITKDENGLPIPHPYPTIKPILGCLLKGQEIVTKNGVKESQDIKVGDFVLTHRGRFKKVTRIMKRVHTGTFFKIRLSNWRKKELILTDEHPILVADNKGKTQWKLPGEIGYGRINKNVGLKHWKSYACLPKLSNISCNVIKIKNLLPSTMGIEGDYICQLKKYSKYASLRKWNNIPLEIDLDEEVSYFLGLFCAEGWTKGIGQKKDGSFGLSFSIKEGEYANFCVSFLKNRFNINAKIVRKPEKNQMEVYACCLPFSHILANLCGENAKSKKIPAEIYETNLNNKNKFIRGLLDGDGKNPLQRSNIGKQETLKVASRDLSWGFKILIADLGFWSSVSKVLDRKSGRISYSVPFNPQRKYSRNLSNDDYIFKPIAEITDFKDSKEVFNFTVKDDNSYVSEFILHNCEFYLSGSRFWKSKAEQSDGKKGNRHLNLFAKNFIGYQNLCTLSEKSFTEGFYFNPRIDFDLLSKYSEGLMCSSACLSNIVNANLLHDRYDMAKKACGIFKDIFGEDFFLEVMYHGIDEEKLIIEDIIKLGKELDIPLIATNDVHYIKKEQAKSHEVVMCMSSASCLTNPNHIKLPYDEFYLKSAEEMAAIFSKIPESLSNTIEFASRIDDNDISKKLFGGMKLPKFDIPKEFKTTSSEFENKFNYLKYLIDIGMKKRNWDKSPAHLKQLEIELQDTRVAWESNKYDFVTYYLIEADIMRFANESEILTGPGRGSGYASVILHCLGICYGTDPIVHGLIWERFLGFDSKRFMRADDLGFEEEFDISKLIDEQEDEEEEEEDLLEDRSVEDDPGGVDRY